MGNNCDFLIKKYEPIWGNWYIDSLIGKGSYGKVFRAVKNEWNLKIEAAVKVITIPTDEQKREARATVGTDPNRQEEYYTEVLNGIINEIKLLYKLKGNSNIVSYEDHLVKKREDLGWDILIRMEYVKPLESIASNRKLKREEIISIGIDICSALEMCDKYGIIHRDIKEENIFVSQSGKFKLGDFGIAREMSKGEKGASMRGTPLYLAPEVFSGNCYDKRSDVYSLGIVLYKLFNHGRYPFMPAYPQEIKYSDGERALVKRLSGEKMPAPSEADSFMSRVILKACSYKPEERYSCAADLKIDLEKALKNFGKEEGHWFIDLSNGKLDKLEAQPAEITSAVKHKNNLYAGKKGIKIEGDWIYL